jgi:hypothetical protein
MPRSRTRPATTITGVAPGRPADAEPPTLLAIDHLFADDEAALDAVYQALGGLDAACPLTLAPLSTCDLGIVVAAASAFAATLPASVRRDALGGACRRLGHVLDRAPG